MRLTRSLLGAVLCLPALVAGAAAVPASADAREAVAPAVKQVRQAYGDGPVRLRPRQGVDVSFPARRGDRVMLDVNSRTRIESPCFGRQTLVDGRGRRTAPLKDDRGTKIFTVRTTGRAVLSFRGACAHHEGDTPHPMKAQLTKVRMREVERNGRTSVRGPRRGFVDVAYVRVARDGRDTLTLRTAQSLVQRHATIRMLVGSRMEAGWYVPSLSVEAGQPLVNDTWHVRHGLRSGQRVGLVVREHGYAESLRAREHRVALDGPALTLPAEPGREHVLTYEATPEDRAYVLPLGLPKPSGRLDEPGWGTWRTYHGGHHPDGPSLQRTIVSSDADGAGQQSQQVRVRRTVRVPDLVVGGPPITFASTEPGTRFVATIPASTVGSVQLTASNVSATGPWQTSAPPTVCPRDCYDPGLEVGPEAPVAEGHLFGTEPHELRFTFEANATGSVTLTLTDIP